VLSLVSYQVQSGGALSSQGLAIAVGTALAGWLTPAFIITTRAKRRVRLIARGLPDALELLVVCVEAGLSLDDGLDRVVAELWESHPALADELALLSADLRILPSRDQALTNLAERVDLPSIRSIVGTLSQTMRFGTPLAQAMKVVAGEMRNDVLLSMEERANRLPALMTVPMIIFILPTIMLILGGPAMLRVLDQLSQ
jgi:tight adherence protein C